MVERGWPGRCSLGDVNAIATDDGTELVVATANAPQNVPAWNVYAGTAADLISLQTAEPIAVRNSWALPVNGLVLGATPKRGQEPDYFLFHDRRIQRG